MVILNGYSDVICLRSYHLYFGELEALVFRKAESPPVMWINFDWLTNCVNTELTSGHPTLAMYRNHDGMYHCKFIKWFLCVGQDWISLSWIWDPLLIRKLEKYLLCGYFDIPFVVV